MRVVKEGLSLLAHTVCHALSTVHSAASAPHFNFCVRRNVRKFDPRQAMECVKVRIRKHPRLKSPFDGIARPGDLHGVGSSLRTLHRRLPLEFNNSLGGKGIRFWRSSQRQCIRRMGRMLHYGSGFASCDPTDRFEVSNTAFLKEYLKQRHTIQPTEASEEREEACARSTFALTTPVEQRGWR